MHISFTPNWCLLLYFSIWFCERSETTTTATWWTLTLFSRLSSGGFVCFQRTKSNCDVRTADQKQHRWSHKWRLSSYFPTPNVTYEHLKVPCHTDSSQPTPSTLLPSSDAPTKDTVPTATANGVRERHSTLSHVTIQRAPVWWRASKQGPSKWISFLLAFLLFLSSADALMLTFLVPLADTSNDGVTSRLWHKG